MPCLDELTILELVQGGLARDRLALVDEHLDSCAQCREVVVEVARTTSGDSPVSGLRGGAQLGRYAIIDVVGRGAFGVVYRAHDPQLQRKVALKVLRADSDRRVEERLLREAKAMAQLSHPHVVAVYEVGQAQQSTFIAMELVEGMTLRQWLQGLRAGDADNKAKALDWRAVVNRFIQAGEGLAAAHAAGLIHRDFKPDNVLIGSDGRARVGDFGLARAGRDVLGPGEVTAGGATASQSGVRARQREPGSPQGGAQAKSQPGVMFETMTATGSVLGTPAYMSPEQLRGEAADARSDQFSFCVALYEALCGQRPFGGSSLSALRHQLSHAAAAPLPPPAKASGPRWLWRVLSRGLSPRPERRYASMKELLAALRRGLSRGRQRWWVAAAAAAVLSGSALVALASSSAAGPCEGGEQLTEQVWGSARSGQLAVAFEGSRAPYAAAAERAVHAYMDQWSTEWAQSHGQICRATRVRGDQSERLLDQRMRCLERQRQEVDALIAQLLHADAETVARAPEALASLSPPSACAQRQAPDKLPAPSDAQAAELQSFERARADVLATLATGRYAAATESAERLVSQAEQIAYPPAVATAQLVYAEALARAAHLRKAEEHALKALWAAQRMGDGQLEARAWLLSASAAGMRGDYEQAERASRHAEALMSRLSLPMRMRAKLHNTLGLVHYNLGRHEQAAKQLKRALSLRTDALGQEHLEVARSYTNLGNLSRARGDYDAALKHHRRAREIDRSLLGEQHPNEGRHLHNIARIFFLRGDRAAALERYQRALAIKKKLLGDGHADVALTHNSLGLVYFDAGELDRAERHYLQALEVFGDKQHIDAAVAHYNLGLLELSRRNADAALHHYTQALPMYEQLLGRGHKRVAELLLAMGDAERARGDTARASKAYQRAHGIAKQLPAAAELLAQIEAARAALRSGGDTRTAMGRPPAPAPVPLPSAPSAPVPPPAAQPAPVPISLGIPLGRPPRAEPRPMPKPAPAPKPAPPRPKPRGTYGSGQAWD